MELIIYTTYATAMRHRPENLAASGGLQPAGFREPRERRARSGLARARCWLGVVLAWARPLRERNDRRAGAGEPRAATLSGEP